MKKRLFLLAGLLVAGLVGCKPGSAHPHPSFTPRSKPTTSGGPAKNVVLVIGDGMGAESVKAASDYAYGAEGKLSFESFPCQGVMTHNAAGGVVTDSAASATAMATGVKVTNGVVSVQIPGNGQELPTILERLQAEGFRVGLVTNSYIEDATPAAFAAHDANRGHVDNIAREYVQVSRPDVLMGGYSVNGLTPDLAAASGYEVVETRAQLKAFANDNTSKLAGLFGIGHMPYEFDGDYKKIPDLSEMTAKALQVLGLGGKPFFLLVENENIDESGHANQIERNIAATVELSDAVQEILKWEGARNDTLIVVTADHETGGLAVEKARGKGAFPKVSWSTNGHTQTPVPVYAKGPGAENFAGSLDNVDLSKRVLQSLGR